MTRQTLPELSQRSPNFILIRSQHLHMEGEHVGRVDKVLGANDRSPGDVEGRAGFDQFDFNHSRTSVPSSRVERSAMAPRRPLALGVA